MSAAPFMPLWVGDFLLKTGDLDARETGAYLLLLMAMWSRDGTLPDDQRKLQRVAKCGREWPAVWASIRHYFDAADGRITNKRLTEELQKVCAKREVNQHNGGLGGRAKALKDKGATLANASVSLQQSYSDTEVEKGEAKASLKKNRGSRLPEDWFLPMDWGEWAMTEGVGRDFIKAEAERFKDYWLSKAGKDAVKLDWQATWRNWIRSAKDRKHGNGNHNVRQLPQGRERPDAAIAQIARLTGIDGTQGNAGPGVGSPFEEGGSLWVGSRPQ